MEEDTVKMTYAELLERLRQDSELPERRKVVMMSAVRQFARRFEPAGLGAMIVPSEISATVARATPAMAQLTEGSFSNMISKLRVALRRYGIIVQSGKSMNPLVEPWATLFRPVKEHTQRSRLSRFFHTASARGWKPEEITADHFWQFVEELEQKAVLKSPRRVAREAAKILE